MQSQKYSFLSLFFLFTFSGNVWASYDADDIKEILKQIKKNEDVNEVDSIDDRHTKVVRVVVGPIEYTLDLQAKLCFARSTEHKGFSHIPCEPIIRGYPLIGKLFSRSSEPKPKQKPKEKKKKNKKPK